jgi:hypothetical protein
MAQHPSRSAAVYAASNVVTPQQRVRVFASETIQPVDYLPIR